MSDTPADLAVDLDRIRRIDAVSTILEVICRTTGMRFSAVARVTNSHWIACAVRDEVEFGLKPGSELKIETTICNEIRASGKAVIIDHVSEDPTFRTHPTPKMYGFESYIAVPVIERGGRFFGTLCALDPRPAKVNTLAIVGMFHLFADLIAHHLEAQDRLAATTHDLTNSKKSTTLCEQFIAVLGHDLRTPLSTINMGLAQLEPKLADDSGAAEVLRIMQRSHERMQGLIGDVLDFARGRLGGGISANRVADGGLEAMIRQVVSEIRHSAGSREFDVKVEVPSTLHIDRLRIGQLVSNLVANAVTHGDPDSDIRIHASTNAQKFLLSVENRGPAIPEAVQGRLFEPFVRGAVKPGAQGLGLGLYIASQIASAHGGKLTVHSADGIIRFTFEMPITAVEEAPTCGSAVSA
jgi:signal transduction histidine kinase